MYIYSYAQTPFVCMYVRMYVSMYMSMYMYVYRHTHMTMSICAFVCTSTDARPPLALKRRCGRLPVRDCEAMGNAMASGPKKGSYEAVMKQLPQDTWPPWND